MDRAELNGKILDLEQQIGNAHRRYTPLAWLDLNLTIAQLKSLFFIDFEGSTNFRKLAAALRVTPPDVTRIVDRLVEQGMVSRRENPEDRRMLLLQTTEKGKALLGRLRENRMTHMHHILAQLETEELAALTQGLAALARAIQQEGATGKHEHNRS